jgi:hypothetical protein
LLISKRKNIYFFQVQKQLSGDVLSQKLQLLGFLKKVAALISRIAVATDFREAYKKFPLVLSKTMQILKSIRA